MILLHIAQITADPCSGVDVAVPQQVRAQQEWETVGFLNLTNVPVAGIANQLTYQEPFRLEGLEKPFDKPELVIFHNVYQPKYLAIAQVLRKRGIPYVIVPHGCLTRQAQSRKWLKKAVANLYPFGPFLGGTRAVQCLSQREQAAMTMAIPAFVSPNGVAMPREEKPVSGEPKNLLYIGRLDLTIKGLDLMLEGISLAAEALRQVGAKVTICGPNVGQTLQTLTRQAESLGIEDLLQFRDAVLGEEKENLLRQADGFLQTSRSEGMPMGILEAMSYGLPCLITEGTGLTELVAEYEAGWICPTTAAGIARALNEFCAGDADTFARRSRGARRLIAQRFEKAAVARQTIAQFRALTGSRSEF